MMRKLALVVLALALTGAAQAAGPNPIETRQAGQDLMLGDFAGIRAVVAAKGSPEYVPPLSFTLTAGTALRMANVVLAVPEL